VLARAISTILFILYVQIGAKTGVTLPKGVEDETQTRYLDALDFLCRGQQLFVLVNMGGGTFFKVEGHKCTLKNYRKFLWFELATKSSQALKYYVINYTPYEGLNYTILDKTTPLLKVSVNHLKFK